MRFLEILTLITVCTGVLWLWDVVFLRPRRALQKVSLGSLTRTASQEPWWVDYVRSFFPVLLIVLLLRAFLAEPFRIPSASMRPTVVEGDFILVNKFTYGLRLPVFGKKIWDLGSPKRGEVIVFRHSAEQDMIKRVVGIPGDHIQYKDKILYINGVPAKQEFIGERLDFELGGDQWPVRHQTEQLGEHLHDLLIQSSTPSRLMIYQYNDLIVPENSYFVMGDNRDNSRDSRMWGFVKDQDIMGRAFAVWMSWDADHYKVRWDRIATAIR